MRFIVCGGRRWYYTLKSFQILDAVQRRVGVSQIISGGARGADAIAEAWAKDRGVELKVFHAKWELYGKRAGILRNIEMLEEEPDGVIAFPGGTGTQHMVTISRSAGVKVWEPFPQ